MKKHNFYSQVLFATLIAVLSVSSAFPSEGGSDGTRGGGDPDSTEIRRILGWMEPDQLTKHSELLIRFLTSFTSYPVSTYRPETAVGVQLHELVKAGIIEDIKAAKYEAQPKCVDENGIERAASTQRVDLSKSTNKVGPTICINVRRLAQNRVGYLAFLGLLLHEHARHFGKEDTDKFGIHPIAEFYVNNERSYMRPRVKFIKPEYTIDDFLPTLKIFRIPESNPEKKIYRSIDLVAYEMDSQPEIVVTALAGSCNKAVIYRSYQNESFFTYSDKLDRTPVSIGTRIKMLPLTEEKLKTEYYSPTHKDVKIAPSILRFNIENEGPFKKSCELSYRIEFKGQASQQFTTTVYTSHKVTDEGEVAEKRSFSQINMTYFDPYL